MSTPEERAECRDDIGRSGPPDDCGGPAPQTPVSQGLVQAVWSPNHTTHAAPGPYTASHSGSRAQSMAVAPELRQ